MNRFLAVLLLMVPVILFAQPAPDTLWTRTFGGAGDDIPSAIRQTSDGGYIIAGSTTSFGAGDQDAYVLKLDSLGGLDWQRTYGNAGGIVAMDVRQTQDGGYIIVVDSTNSGAFWLLKLSGVGDSLWGKAYDLSEHQNAFRVAILTQGFLVTCVSDTQVNAGFSTTRYLLAVDSIGDTLWTRRWPGWYGPYTDTYTWGDMDCSASGEIVISGSWHAGDPPPITNPRHNWQVYVYSTNGDSQRTVTSEVQAYSISAGAVSALREGGCLLQVTNYGIVHVDSSGNRVLVSEHAESADLCALSQQQGYVRLTTETGHGNDISLAAWGYGDPLYWQGTWGGAGNDQAVALEATSDSGYVIVGTTTSFGAGGTDIYVIKTDPHHWLNADHSRTGIPSSFTLSTYPNPFNPSTTLSFSLPKAGRAKLSVYNVEGRLVKVLTDEMMQAGEHRIAFDGSALPSGIYFARLNAGEMAATSKIMLLK